MVQRACLISFQVGTKNWQLSNNNVTWCRKFQQLYPNKMSIPRINLGQNLNRAMLNALEIPQPSNYFICGCIMWPITFTVWYHKVSLTLSDNLVICSISCVMETKLIGVMCRFGESRDLDLQKLELGSLYNVKIWVVWCQS